MTKSYNNTFGETIDLLRQGYIAQRKGWNGKNMFIYVEEGKVMPDLREPLKSWSNREAIEVLPHFNMVNAKSQLVVGWLASQEDMLSDDWTIAEQANEF